MLNKYLRNIFLHGCQIIFLVEEPTFMVRPCPRALSVVAYASPYVFSHFNKSNFKRLFVATQDIKEKRIVLITNRMEIAKLMNET